MKQISATFSPDLDEKKIFETLEKRAQILATDWNGGRSAHPPFFDLQMDQNHFYFVAGRNTQPITHPEATLGRYQEELWKYEVAEFFLSDPENGTYLEFNLSPEGAWWSCRFEAPRQPLALEPQALEGIETFSRQQDNQWAAMAKIPLAQLGKIPQQRLNVCFITNHREQKFYTAAPPQTEAPDFHQPHHFLPIKIIPSVG